MNKKGIAITLILVLVAGLMLTACTSSGGGKEGGDEQKVIKIGASVPLTGNLAKEGKLTEQGYRLWEEVINGKGGIDVGGEKYKVEIILYDDKSEAQTSAKLTEKLITEDGVDFLFGPYSSGLVQATSSIAEKYQKVNLAPTGNSNTIFNRGYKYVFGILPRATSNLIGCLKMVDEYGLDVKKVAILHPDDLFPTFSAEGAKRKAEELGMEVVYFMEYPAGTSDFSTMVAEMKPLQPDAVLSSCYFEEAILLTRQLKEQGMSPKMIAYIGPTGIPDFQKSLGKDAEGIIGHDWWTTATLWKDPIFGTGQDYAKLFSEKYGIQPTYHAAAATATGLALQFAIENAGTIENEAVRQALEDLEVETFFMPINFGEVDDMVNINIAGESLPVQIQNGEVKTLYPAQIKQADPIFPKPDWK
jgi:branched-chain amino acid transport system substrate-binding protein